MDLYLQPSRPQSIIDFGEITETGDSKHLHLWRDFTTHHPDLNAPSSTQYCIFNDTGKHVIQALSSSLNLQLVNNEALREESSISSSLVPILEKW